MPMQLRVACPFFCPMKQKNTFHQVRCSAKKSNDRTCNHYLGDIQIDVANTARFYCKHCNCTLEYSVDADGLIRRRVVGKGDQFVYYDKPVIIG